MYAGCERDGRLLIDIVEAEGHAPIALQHPTARATEMVLPQKGSETFMARHLQHAKQRNKGGERRRGVETTEEEVRWAGLLFQVSVQWMMPDRKE